MAAPLGVLGGCRTETARINEVIEEDAHSAADAAPQLATDAPEADSSAPRATRCRLEENACAVCERPCIHYAHRFDEDAGCYSPSRSVYACSHSEEEWGCAGADGYNECSIRVGPNGGKVVFKVLDSQFGGIAADPNGFTYASCPPDLDLRVMAAEPCSQDAGSSDGATPP